MSRIRNQIQPGVEGLDARVVLSTATLGSSVAAAVSRPPTHLTPAENPSANAARPFTQADLQAYARAFTSSLGEPGYTPQYDFNGTGFIGQNDATPILRGLASITPKIPLKLQLALAPGEQVQGHHPSDSGGVTRLRVVTILGKTTPNAIVFVDGVTGAAHNTTIGLFKFNSAAVATDSQGDFAFTVTLPPTSQNGSLGVTSFLIRTPFNQQLTRVFPVLRIQ